MKPDIYKTLRPALATWARSVGMKRIKSSPPSYAMPYGLNHASVWVQQSRGGYDWLIGGSFTLNLQYAYAPCCPHTSSVRIPSYWDEEDRQRAIEIHNDVVAKRRRPAQGTAHPFESFMKRDDIEKRYYTPIAELAVDHWMPFVDADDGIAWGALLTRSLPGALERFLASVGAEGPSNPAS